MTYSDLVPMLLTHYKVEFTHDDTHAQFLCPFHQEDSASCRMEFERGVWHCFGCGRGGGFYHFIELMEENPDDAMRVNRRLMKGQPTGPASTPTPDKAREDEEPFDYIAAFTRLSKIDWALLSKSHDAYRYFVRKRGLSPYTLSAFDARLTASDDYPVVIPVMRAGEMMGYVKRYVGDDPDMKRYLYNKDFKGKEALAYHRVGENGPCLIVEGMMDYLKAAQFGARHVAATLSWRIKQPQVDFLHDQGVDEVVCALDDDDRGREGCTLLVEHFGVKRFLYPGPPAKDISDLNQNEFWHGYENAYVPKEEKV